LRSTTAPFRAAALAGLLLVTAVAIAACGSTKPQSQATPASHLYVNEEFHFSLLVDSRFENIHPMKLPGAALKVGLSDADGAASGVTPDGIMITLIDKKRNAGRNDTENERLLKKLVGQIEAAGPGDKEWHTTTVGGLPAAWTEDIDPATGYPRVSYLVVGHRNVYLMAGEATKESWDASRSQFVAAFESFRES
jgi:hypothetical protein